MISGAVSRTGGAIKRIGGAAGAKYSDISYEMKISLIITFNDGFIIELNNIKDTNNHHNPKFKEAIKDILKQLM